jgi:hypothetical protein
MSSFAELERDMIVERTQQGKTIGRKRKDFREGMTRKFKKKQIELALQLLGKHTYTEVESMTGISKRTLIRQKKEQEEKKTLNKINSYSFICCYGIYLLLKSLITYISELFRITKACSCRAGFCCFNIITHDHFTPVS